MLDPRLAPYRAPSLAFAGFLLLQAVSGAVLFLLKLGPSARGVQQFYLGAPERFAAAKTFAGLLHVALPHLIAIPIVLFAAAHIIGFARTLERRAFGALVGLSFGSALLGVVAGFGVRWLAPELAWIKIAAFVGFEAALLAWAGLLFVLFRPERRAVPAGVASRTQAT